MDAIAGLTAKEEAMNPAKLSLLTSIGAALLATYAAADDEPSKEMIIVSPEDAKFAPVNPQRPEDAQIAVLWGDPNTGPSATLLRMNRGTGRMHVHSADYHCIVIEGTMQHWAEGQLQGDAKPLERGSFWFQPGNAPHADACLSETCLLYVQWVGKRDARLAQPSEK
jgi:hypothetical protein